MALSDYHNWKLDGVNFLDYGVHVYKAQGVLDIPPIVNQGTNWLDEFGLDYKIQPEELVFGDSEIVLSCWIRATNFADFTQKVNTFYAVLCAPGQRFLTTPYRIFDKVSVQKGINLVRETAYNAPENIGTFTLRFTVEGTPQTKDVVICAPDDTPLGTYKMGTDAVWSKQMMGQDVITLRLEFNTMQTNIVRDCYINYNNMKYLLLESPEIEKLSSNKYVFTLRFENIFFRLRDIQFRKFNRCEFYWWANLTEIMNELMLNVERLYPGVFGLNYVQPNTIYKNFSFSSQSCMDVLQTICQEYEMEYNYQRGEDGLIRLTIRPTVGVDTTLSISYGKGNGVYSLTRSTTAREAMVTHLYAYGSQRNLPSTYRADNVGVGRLCLGPEHTPLVSATDSVIREKTIVFEDIYPSTKYYVDSYTYQGAEKPEDCKYKLIPQGAFFDLLEKEADGVTTKYLFAGTTCKVHFNTGACAGFEFEVATYQHTGEDAKTLFLIPLKEANDMTYPGGTDGTKYLPAFGDEFVLLDIKMPDTAIAAAEALLLERAQQYLARYNTPKSEYTIQVEPGFDIYSAQPGDKITVTDADFQTQTLRITGIEKNMITQQSSLWLSELVQVPNRFIQKKALEQLGQSLKSAQLVRPENLRRSELNTGELKNAVINPLDQKLKADEIVRTQSLDGRMLSPDAFSPQWHLKNAVFSEDETTPGKINWTQGSVVVHNWYGKTRAEIKVITRELYHPEREWTISQGTISPPPAPYHAYLKLPEDELQTTGTVELQADYLTEMRYEGYVYLLLGSVDTTTSPATMQLLFGGGKGRAGVTDHGLLSGLADDDHPQYHNNDRGDARYLQRASNLSDLADAPTARTNLGLGSIATRHFWTGTLAAYNAISPKDANTIYHIEE